MEVNKKQLADIFGASIRTIQNWQEQGMPVLRGGGKGNEVLYDSAAVIKWYAERDAEIENEKLRREVEELRQASEADLSHLRKAEREDGRPGPRPRAPGARGRRADPRHGPRADAAAGALRSAS